MKRIVAPFMAIIVIVLVLSSCVETETKRTTKKVDASQVKVYEIDMNRPRLRLALAVPDYIEVNIRNMLFVEIDDGEHRYGFGGDVFAPDTTEEGDLLYSPWINTPDSGDLIVSFRLAYETGANIVDDRLSIGLKPARFWQVEFGVLGHDPCPNWPDVEVCRSYSLPRDVETSGDGQLYLVCRGGTVMADSQNPSK